MTTAKANKRPLKPIAWDLEFQSDYCRERRWVGGRTHAYGHEFVIRERWSLDGKLRRFSASQSSRTSAISIALSLPNFSDAAGLCDALRATRLRGAIEEPKRTELLRRLEAAELDKGRAHRDSLIRTYRRLLGLEERSAGHLDRLEAALLNSPS